MEEAAVATLAFLFRLILLVAVGAGVLTLGLTGFARRRSENAGGQTIPVKSSVIERTAMGVSAVISLLALVVAIQTIRLSGVDLRAYRPLSVLFVVSTILLGLPAVLWKTRLRWAAEGFASIALVVVAVLSVFSIGFLFLPLLVLMTWICIQHLHEVDNLRKVCGGTAARAGT
ncbi:MAG TPA: hypothetical protein VHE82_08090 [Gemmatimonadaceae bacterium]|nr:hypothetical protein [Gemmatimonadaceae bacterium]